MAGTLASFTGDGGYDQDRIYNSVAVRHPKAAVIVPPRATAVPSEMAEAEPTQRDRHLQLIAAHGRMSWQKMSGYTKRARAKAAIARWKQVIGNGLRSRADERRATEVAVAAHALNRMLAAASRQHQRGKPARSAPQAWLQPPRAARILSHQSFRSRRVDFRHRF